MMQGVPLRSWPADAVHDTVAAVLRGAAFQRDVRKTLLASMFRWLSEGISWLAEQLHGMPGGRTAVIWITAAVCALVLARVLFAARARDPDAAGRMRVRTGQPERDPWRAADALASAGDHAAASHMLYRAVLEGLAQHERVRLHASKTSGDYARELRMRRSSASAAFQAFVRRFEDAMYGHDAVDAALTDDLRRLAEPFRHQRRAA